MPFRMRSTANKHFSLKGLLSTIDLVLRPAYIGIARRTRAYYFGKSKLSVSCHLLDYRIPRIKFD